MNRVRLSGILMDVTEHGGEAIITGRLEKIDLLGTIRFVATGLKARKSLGPFDSGDHILIEGRLAGLDGRLHVLLDECRAWSTGQSNTHARIPRSLGVHVSAVYRR